MCARLKIVNPPAGSKQISTGLARPGLAIQLINESGLKFRPVHSSNSPSCLSPLIVAVTTINTTCI